MNFWRANIVKFWTESNDSGCFYAKMKQGHLIRIEQLPYLPSSRGLIRSYIGEPAVTNAGTLSMTSSLGGRRGCGVCGVVQCRRDR